MTPIIILNNPVFVDQPEDGSVCEPKHVARNTRNTTNSSNKLRVIYNYIIL